MEIENILKQIFSERGLESRPHQVRNILDYITPDKPHVAAIATAGGKTIMTAAKFELYYRCGLLKKTNKVLILPADKTILRGNFVKQFDNFFEKGEKSFTYCGVEDRTQLIEAVENDIQVIIGLPQLIKDHAKLLKNITWLVVDESHKWYFADTIRNIIRDVKPKHQFLLTGTPFKFNLHKNNYIIDYTSVKTLYEQGFIGDVNMQVLHTSLALSRMDWVSMTDNLRSDKRIDKEDLDRSFTEVIEELVKKLKLPFKKLSTAHNISNNAMSVFGKLQKTIIFTHGIAEANCVSEYLKVCGVNCIVSHSKIDGEIAEESFNSFKDDKDIKVLVSVNRGKEGFDFPELYNIIDMTYSQNFEVVMQMVGRLLRPSKDETFKVFYKVAPKNTSGYFTDWMDCMIQLFDDYWYSKFNGRNTLDIRVPNALLNRPKQPKIPTFIQDGSKKIEVSSGTSLSKGTKIQVVGADNKKEPLKDGTYKVPQPPTNNNPNPTPIEIEVKKGVITKTTAPITGGRLLPKNLQTMGFDNSLSFMEKNDWFRLEDPLSTVATTTLRKVIYNLTGSMKHSERKEQLYLPFNEAQSFVVNLNFKGREEWLKYCEGDDFPDFLPKAPHSVYEEFTTYGDFLGNGYVANRLRKYKSYNDAKIYMKTLNIETAKDWERYKKNNEIPNDIPKDPYTVYSNTGEWKGWGDYLGTNVIASQNKEYRSCAEASKWAIKLQCGSVEEYRNYVKNNTIPDDIPKDPSSVYKRRGEWNGWSNYLGLKNELTKEQILEAQKLYNTAHEIAKYLGVSYTTYRLKSEKLGVYKKMDIITRNKKYKTKRKK
jgi:superfamily II DNA or RNA helicase